MIPVTVIGGRAGQNKQFMLKTLEEARQAGTRCVVYVPEQYTLQAEREIMEGLDLPGLLDIDVLSPKKLLTWVRELAGDSGRQLLDDCGEAMAVLRALKECGEKLRFYQKSYFYSGAAAEMMVTLAEFRECGMTVEELENCSLNADDEAQKAKYRDLALVWRAYDELLGEQFEDRSSAGNQMLLRLAESRLLDNALLFVFGFDTLRPALRRLICAAAPAAARVAVSLEMDGAGAEDANLFTAQRDSVEKLRKELENAGIGCVIRLLPHLNPFASAPLAWLEAHLFTTAKEAFSGVTGEDITVFTASGPEAEAWNAVNTLKAWHDGGIPWGKMAVALPPRSGLSSPLAAALSMSDVPYYMDRKAHGSHHGLSRLLIGALRSVSGGYRQEDVLLAANSGFSGLTADEAMRLENYAIAHGIRYRRWLGPFVGNGEADGMEPVRERLIKPIEQLHKELLDASAAAASVEAIVRFLQAEDAYGQLMRREDELLKRGLRTEAIENRQVWERLMNLLDQLWALLGGKRCGLKDMAMLIENGLGETHISSLPSETDAVSVGEAGHMLAGDTDALIFMGMTEGLYLVGDSGLLNDADRSDLEQKTGKTVGQNLQSVQQLRISDYYKTLALPRKKLRLSRSMSTESGQVLRPAGLLTEIRNMFKDAREEGGVLDEGCIRDPDSYQTALDGLASRLRDMKTGISDDLTGDWKAALKQLWDNDEWHSRMETLIRRLLGDEMEARLLREQALRLFPDDSVSISRLEMFAGCRYMHFVRYGLRPVPRQQFEFRADEKGIFFHRALQEFLTEACRQPDWPRWSAERTHDVMEGVLSVLTKDWEGGPLREDALGIWEGEGYIRRAHNAARALTLFAANSRFRTVATECSFGPGCTLPPVVLKLGDGTSISLRGTMDRLDEYAGERGKYLRVVDNKSSRKELEYDLMATGEQLQLMIYLKAAVDGIPGSVPAGALYFPVKDENVASEEPDKAETERAKKLKMTGVILADNDVVNAMDVDLSPFSIGKVYNKDGGIGAQVSAWAVGEKELRGMMNASAEKAAELCEEIRDGRIDIAPSEHDKRTPCTYCEYFGICRYKKGLGEQEAEGEMAETAEKEADADEE